MNHSIKGNLAYYGYLSCLSVTFRLFDKFENQINAISQEVWRDMSLLEDSSSGEDEETGLRPAGPLQQYLLDQGPYYLCTLTSFS